MERQEININEKYHEKIIKVWNKGKEIPELEEIYKNGAFVQDTLYKKSLLFLGVGASKGEDKLKTIVPKPPVQYETEKGRDDYDYYKKMKKLAKTTGFDHWSNIDITLFRETSQKLVKPLFIQFQEVMQAHFDLAKEMIVDVNPKVIIVSNAFVRNILRGEEEKINITTGFSFDEDDGTIKKYGTPLINSPNELKDIPVFFTSMLSGAGALDNGSFERLSWHIRYVLEKL